jgi:DNA-binding CsgD family transcriptional regulator
LIVHITPRERATLALLSEGHSYEGAAANLAISINTIRNHVRRIYDKLAVHSKAEAVRKGFEHGLLEPTGGGSGCR